MEVSLNVLRSSYKLGIRIIITLQTNYEELNLVNKFSSHLVSKTKFLYKIKCLSIEGNIYKQIFVKLKIQR